MLSAKEKIQTHASWFLGQKIQHQNTNNLQKLICELGVGWNIYEKENRKIRTFWKEKMVEMTGVELNDRGAKQG